MTEKSDRNRRWFEDSYKQFYLNYLLRNTCTWHCIICHYLKNKRYFACDIKMKKGTVSVHPNNTYCTIYPTRYNATQFILSGNCSTCFGWYHHPPSGAETTVSTASGNCHTVIAIFRYPWRVGTSLSVLWVAYATHSTLKPVPTLQR